MNMLSVCISQGGNLKHGEVYEVDPARSDDQLLFVHDGCGIFGYQPSRFQPIKLDDAYSTTHWLDGTTSATTARLATRVLNIPTIAAPPRSGPDPLKDQVGGSHYKHYKIQPIEYAQANKLGPCEFNVVKYATRHKDKGGKQDLQKAIHMLQLLIQLEYPDK